MKVVERPYPAFVGVFGDEQESVFGGDCANGGQSLCEATVLA